MRVADVFLRCVFGLLGAKSQDYWERKLLLEATQAPTQPADPSLAHFLEHPTAACPRSVMPAGQKCPQFCGNGRSWMLNELCLELVPQKEVQERDIRRTRLLKLDCTVPHCLVVLTSKHESVRRRVVQEQSKLTPRLHEGCAVGQAKLHEVQRRCNVKSAHDARDRSLSVTPWIAAVCRHRQAHRSLKCCATAKSLGVPG